MSIMIHVASSPKELGAQAAAAAAGLLNDAVRCQGYARLVLSTGASQFETLDALPPYHLGCPAQREGRGRPAHGHKARDP